MTTLMIEDIPLIEELSDGAARKIVGGSATNMPVEPDGGIGNTPKMIHWEFRHLFPGFPGSFSGWFAYAV